ncbi:MAG: hypothetical protein ACH350_00420 [Parachlamydiaceae bacterium]
MINKTLLLLLTSLTLTGCYYQFGRGELSQRYHTISVPYAKGDQKGELTALVIRKLGTSGGLRYVSQGGDLILKIELIEFREENLEFRYDRKKTGQLKHSIIPTETRVKAFAEVLLVEAGTGITVKGPTRIAASAEFDHTYYATRGEINIFSLGQLNDFDGSRDAVMHPLNRNLAEKIVDYVINSW